MVLIQWITMRRALQEAQRKGWAYHRLQLISGEEREKRDRHDSGHPLTNGSYLLIKFAESEKENIRFAFHADHAKSHYVDGRQGVRFADTVSKASRTEKRDWPTEFYLKNEPQLYPLQDTILHLSLLLRRSHNQTCRVRVRSHNRQAKNFLKVNAVSKVLVTGELGHETEWNTGG